MNIRKSLNVSPIAAHTVFLTTDKIKISVGSVSFLSATKASRVLNIVMGKVEESLALWNGDQNQRNARVSLLCYNGSRSLCLTV